MFLRVAILVTMGFSQVFCNTPTWPNTMDLHVYQHSETLSPNYRLYWEYDNVTITFEVHANTSGWVGLGWSAKGGMKDSDIIIARIIDETTGRYLIEDRHGKMNGKPQLDQNQTESLMKTGRVKRIKSAGFNYTLVKFTRQLDTCDENGEDRPILSGTMRMIWAIGEKDDLKHHGFVNRGTKSMQLIGMKILPDIKNTTDVMIADIRAAKPFKVPASTTHYMCVLLKIPKLKEKHHVIQFEPLITPGNERHVHHMLAYFCPSSLNETNAQDDYGVFHNCYYGNSTAKTHRECQHILFGWAAGAQQLSFPKHVGLPIGKDEPMYLKLEIHYDNPARKSGLVDQSGFRIFYTKTLRPHDAGVLHVWKTVDWNHMIPPFAKSFTTRTHCPNKCISEAFKKARVTHPVKVFAAIPHTHLAGVKVIHRHKRSKSEMEPLLRDEYYDFNFQSYQIFEKEKTFDNLSEFVVDCVYDTSDRKSVTFGGLSTRSEMCMTFVYYYPRLPLRSCSSELPDAKISELYKKYNKLPWNYNYNGLSWLQWYNLLKYNISWTKESIAYWQDVEYNSHVNVKCYFKDYRRSYPLSEPVGIDRKLPPISSTRCGITSAAGDKAFNMKMLLMSFILLKAIIHLF